jgi:hypothetical protein
VAITSRTALAAFILILLTGCGSSRPAQDSTDSANDNTASSAPEKPAEPSYRILGKKGLTAALLGVQDLPAGYSQDPPTDEGRNKTFCNYTPPFTEKVKVSRDFTKGGGLSAELLRVGLRQYANPQRAKAAFDALTKALETCTEETYEGTKMTYAAMSAPKVGDGTVGVKITGDDISLPQYFALVGPTLVNTGGGGLMNANADEISNLLKDQVKAYTSAATK